MGEFKLKQTGEEVQEILNNAEKIEVYSNHRFELSKYISEQQTDKVVLKTLGAEENMNASITFGSAVVLGNNTTIGTDVKISVVNGAGLKMGTAEQFTIGSSKIDMIGAGFSNPHTHVFGIRDKEHNIGIGVGGDNFIITAEAQGILIYSLKFDKSVVISWS